MYVNTNIFCVNKRSFVYCTSKFLFESVGTGTRKGHTENNQQLLKACLHSSNFKDRAAHKSGILSNNQTSAYIRIEECCRDIFGCCNLTRWLWAA